jgi:phosphoribosyl 1,2-cyclic phosphodiesterase
MSGMKVRFWGVRGSIASPGPQTAHVGGNTPCVEVVAGRDRFILDAGTGIRKLGEKLAAEGALETTLLFSHLHWDHIQGLPFFAPVYDRRARIAIVGPRSGEMTLSRALEHQMTAPVFPVRLDDLPAELSFRHVKHGESFACGGATIRVARLHHPGGVLAYRIEQGGASVVYATDTEHHAATADPALVDLAREADVLVYDAMYTEAEYRGERGPSRLGWGHSTWEAGVRVAKEAGVRELVLFHHDPTRTDEGVAEIEALARREHASTVTAREGLVLDLAARIVDAA